MGLWTRLSYLFRKFEIEHRYKLLIVSSNTHYMHIKRLFLFFCFLSLLLESKASFVCISNQNPIIHNNISIGVVIDQKSRLGREQTTAIEVAIDELRHCINVSLHIRDSNGSQARATSEAIDLVSTAQVDAIIGPTTPQEAALLSEFTAKIKGNNILPIISLSQTASIPRKLPSPTYLQFSTPISYQTRCIAAIIGHFKWNEAILMQEQGNSYSEVDHSLVSKYLSDSLKEVDASVESHFTIPKLSIEEELKRVRSRNPRVFVLMHVSLEFAVLLFEKAKGLEMMEKGYAWIVSDEVANFLDSVDSSVISNMQGVIGFKTYYDEHFRDFKSKFRRKYASLYPAEEEHSTPSLYSLRAYHAIWAVSNTTETNLSCKSRFKDGVIAQSQEPAVFSIINVIGKSYRELAFWSEQSAAGFTNDLKDLVIKNKTRINLNSNSDIDVLSTILWPGIDRDVPRGVSLGSKENPLVIGISANCTFKQFVQVINDTKPIGFSISVFEASIAKLTHPPSYKFIPHYGTYAELIDKVYNKTYHAAVGDTAIRAERYARVDFSQPYMETELVMIVPSKLALKESEFLALRVFTRKMWIQFAALCVLTGAIVWLSEHSAGNKDFAKTTRFLDLIVHVLWFSVTIISLSQKEQIKTTASKLVLTAWLCTVFVVGASFTAVLSSMLVVPRLQPSIVGLNASVGCNANSFICPYLTDVLHFNPDKIQKINSLDDYNAQFSAGKIKAAFLQSPHAKIFLANNCNDYVIAGPSYKLGGLGFVFEKGSHMTSDVSEAILNITQNGELDNLEKKLITSSSCSYPSDNRSDGAIILGDRPFSGLFEVLGGLIGFTFLIAMVRFMRRAVANKAISVYGLVENTMIKNRIGMWSFLVLIECTTRFGVSFFRQRIVRTGVEPPRPNLVAIELATDDVRSV